MTDATPLPDPAVTSLTAKAGDKVDNYTIMEQVGAGGTAIVFRGHDHVLNRDVAIKQLVVPPGDSGEDIRQRALAESELHKRAAASDPKLLVQYIDTINDPRGLFLISEYVDGPSLEWIVQQETRPMDQRQALGIIAATGKALHALHATGMVHRDLKPSNILMPREGGLKLADFGLAAIIAEQQTLDVGSVRYMAPEVLQGDIATPKSDLYSLGIIAYEMLAGRDKFNEAFRTILRDQRNQSMRWVKWHTNVRAKATPLNQLVPDLPESLAQLVGRMMEKEPARRVGSASELIEAIRNHFAQGGQDPNAAPSPHAAMAPPKIDDASQTAAIPQRSKLPLILAATLVLWVFAIGGFFLYQGRQERIAQEQRIAELRQELQLADSLINKDQDYEAALAAFAKIPNNEKYSDLFVQSSTPVVHQVLVEAGQLKAQALASAQDNDFITALDKAQAYQRVMASLAKPPPQEMAMKLSVSNADELIEEYTKREAAQQVSNEIDQLLDERELAKAYALIRRTLAADSDAAADDLKRLKDQEKRYEFMLVDEATLALLDEANQLRDDGEVNKAIRLLGDEIDGNDEADVDPRITATLKALNQMALMKDLEDDIARARRSGEIEELIATLKAMQSEDPTQARKDEINALEITKLTREAEDALNDGRPETANNLIDEILERDPTNRQALSMRKDIENARNMVASEKRGDQFLAGGEYAKAIEQFKTAMSFGLDTSGRLNDKIKNATGQLHLKNSQLALEEGNVTLAQELADKAELLLGETAVIRDLQANIDDLRDYSLLVQEGDALFTSNSFGRAKVKYLAAKKIFDRPVINQKINDCDFGIWLDQCDQSIISRDWEAAESALNRAEEIKKNDQTRARRVKIANRSQ